MQPAVHLANTDFEFELAHPSANNPIKESWMQHPLCLQLQFLPLLYAGPQDIVAVTAFPSPAFMDGLRQLPWRRQEELPRLILLEEHKPFLGLPCLSWGPSRRVNEWAQQRDMTYHVPTDWNMIRDINSKAFSFCYSTLPEAALLRSQQELENWLTHVSGPKILKTCFGLSGIGNRLIQSNEKAEKVLSFCLKEWEEGRPIVAEPWLDKCFDFSTQWWISAQGSCELLGATVFETSPHGVYGGTRAGPAKELFGSFYPFLEDHIGIIKPLLHDLLQRGFFGFVGVDALLYRCPISQEIKLYPIVEINARQTMSLVALRLQQRYFPERIIRLHFTAQAEGAFSLLPLHLYTQEEQLERTFKRKLILSVT